MGVINGGYKWVDTPPYLAGGGPPAVGGGLPEPPGPTFDLAPPGLLADGVFQAGAIKPQGKITPPSGGTAWGPLRWGVLQKQGAEVVASPPPKCRGGQWVGENHGWSLRDIKVLGVEGHQGLGVWGWSLMVLERHQGLGG